MAILDLFRPKWKHSNPDVRLNAVEKLNNSIILEKIAINEKDIVVHNAAIGKLADQNILHRVLIEYSWGPKYNSYITIIKKISDQKLLADIAKNHKFVWVRKFALYKIDDENVLTDIAKDTECSFLGEAVVTKIINENSIADIATNAKDINVRRAADKKLKDNYITAILGSRSKSKREAAIEKLTDQIILCDILFDKYWKLSDYMYLNVLGKITEQSHLLFIAKYHKDSQVRQEAIKKITDQKVLARFALKDVDEFVRSTAILQITDQNILADISMNDECLSVRLTALEKISNPLYLVDIAKNNHVIIRRAAAMKIGEIAKNQPELLMDHWSQIATILTKRHKDIAIENPQHVDIRESSDCSHTDKGGKAFIHEDFGIGIEFPLYPPKL
jgi:hypothetical protein